MNWNFWLLVAAVVLFVLAAISSFWPDVVNVNWQGFVAVGLACFAGAHLPNPPRP